MAVSAISTWVDKADRLIWPDQSDVDTTTLAHYFFSPYPEGLNKEELSQWCALQIEVLSPFPNSYFYTYRSRLGLHSWFASAPFTGIPETAAQIPLDDGKHIIRSDNFKYIQQWQSGVMRSCVAMKLSHTQDANCQTLQRQHHAWAGERKLVNMLSKPLFWAGFSVLAFAVFMLFVVASYISSSIQLSMLQQESEALSELVGPKLSEQTTLAAYVSSVNYIRNAQTTTRFLPESLSLAISAIPQSATDSAIESIGWQNNQLNMAIKSEELDITQMIENAESIEQIQNANIRPDGNENTWLFEVQL